MSRPSRPWFRFYVEAIHDQKLRQVVPACRWLWVVILAAARQSPRPGYLLVAEDQPMTQANLADMAGLPPKTVLGGIIQFKASRMLDEIDGCLVVTNWADRQFESDDVTERTRQHRSREQVRNVPKSFPGTPPETETDLVKDLSPVLKPRGRAARPSTVVGPAAYHGQNCKCERCVRPPDVPFDPEAASKLRAVKNEMAERWGQKK